MASSGETPTSQADSGPSKPGDASEHWLVRHRWATFVLPLVVYMLSAQLEPKPAAGQADTSAAVQDRAQTSAATANRPDPSDPFGDDDPADATADPMGDTAHSGRFAASPSPWAYPLVYALRIALTLAAMAVVWPGYRQFPLRVNALSFLVGLVGVVVWIGLANLQRDYLALPSFLAQWLGGARPGYDPLTSLQSQPLALVGFLAVRFLGLALVVPIIEEFFLRGFLMRFVVRADWWDVAIGSASGAAIAAMLVYAALTHPGEILAALAWFSLVTVLVARTKNIWDAVAAHALTNLLLGAWVLSTGQWWLW